MGKRDSFQKLLGKSPKPAISTSPVPVQSTPVSNSATPRTNLPVRTGQAGAVKGERNRALEVAITKYIDDLPVSERDAFREASKTLTDKNLLLAVKDCDEKHKTESHFRPQTQPLSRFLALLKRSMAIVALGAGVAPNIFPVVVGGILVVIDLAVNFVDFFTKLSTMLCRFGDFLGPLTEYAKASESEELVLNALATVYRDLLQFCAKTRNIFTKDGVKRKWSSMRIFWRSQWIPFEEEFGDIETDLRHHLHVLSHSGQALTLNTTLDASGAEMDRRRRETIREKKGFLDWLSSISFEKIHDDIWQKKHPDTGDWLIQSARFSEWLNSPKSALLWCYGKPGAGKSVLASNVLEYITSRHVLHKEVGICFAYYSYRSPEMQDPSIIIAALIKQLCRGKDSIPAAFLKIWQESRDPSAIGNQKAFASISQDFNEVFLILDGLDECAKEKRHHILTLISASLRAFPRMKVFVTSRRESDLVQAFRKLIAPTIEVEAKNVAADISKYISDEIETLCAGKIGRQLYLEDKRLKQTIVETLTAKADGMFLWAALQIASLCRVSECRMDSEVKKALSELPLGLDQTYIRALGQIDGQRPLSVRELQHALATDERCRSTNTSDVELYRIEAILGACANLLVRDEEKEPGIGAEEDVIRPVHYSVQEFMMNNLRSLSRTHCMYKIDDASYVHTQLATTCFSYLRSTGLEDPFGTEFHISAYITSHPLAWYAACAFDHHILNSGNLSDRLQREISIFLKRREEFLTAVLQLRSIRAYMRPQWANSFEDFNPYFSSASVSDVVYGTELYNTPGLRKEWENLQPSALALHRACSAGIVTTARFLIDSGYDVNKKDGAGISPLYHAAGQWNIPIVKMLLNAGADVSMTGGGLGTPLQAACSRCDLQMVQVLIDSNADINAQVGTYGTVLVNAASGDRCDLVELLLKNGADINLPGRDYLTSSEHISRQQRSNRANTVVMMGNAEIKAQGITSGTALTAASVKGHIALVQLLLEKGADVNFRGGRFGTPLIAASSSGKHQVVELLLLNGADPGLQAGEYGTALRAAAWGGSSKAVELLLRHGAHINSRAGDFGTALTAASEAGHFALVGLLLKKGADIRIQGWHGTALLTASRNGHYSMVELLLKNGAKVSAEAPRGECGTALITASREGHERIVELLLSHGADVYQQCQGTTALIGASLYGRSAVVELLLSRGADIHQRCQGKTALTAASEYDPHKTLFRRNPQATIALLLSKGAKWDDKAVQTRTDGREDAEADAGKIKTVSNISQGRDEASPRTLTSTKPIPTLKRAPPAVRIAGKKVIEEDIQAEAGQLKAVSNIPRGRDKASSGSPASTRHIPTQKQASPAARTFSKKEMQEDVGAEAGKLKAVSKIPRGRHEAPPNISVSTRQTTSQQQALLAGRRTGKEAAANAEAGNPRAVSNIPQGPRGRSTTPVRTPTSTRQTTTGRNQASSSSPPQPRGSG